MKADDLKWKRVEEFEEIDGDDGFYYGLEEIDDVDLVKEGNRLTFVTKSENTKKTGKNKKSEESVKGEKKTKENTSKKNKKAIDPVVTIRKVDEAEDVERLKELEEDDEEEGDSTGFSALSGLYNEETMVSYGSWPENLNTNIYAGLKKLEFTDPTPIQAQSIEPIMQGHDVIGKASTGSGKTLAYSIPLLQRYYADPELVALRPEGLIVSPTRELAHQIRDHLQALVSRQDKSRIVALTGGLAIQKQIRQLSKSPAIVVATPGRLLELLEQMSQKQQSEWQKIPSLVLDEADRLVQSGSFAELESVLKIIGISKHRQVLVYSATFNTDLWASLTSNKKRKHSNNIRQMMAKKLGLSVTADFIDADPDGKVAESVMQAVIECPNMEKDLYLYYFLLLYPGKSVVFVNSINAVKRITPLLKELGLTNTFGVHSDMVQKQRLRAIERFRETKGATLIATDVAARGLDVPLVDHVVHYHLPRTGDMYVHRSGRTARAGNMGVSVVLCSPKEASGPMPNLVKLISTKPYKLSVDYDVLDKLRDRTTLAKKIADTQSMTTMKGKTESWLTEVADQLGLEIDDDATFGGDLNRNKKKGNKSNGSAESSGALKGMRAELAHMSSQRLGTNRKYLTSGTTNLAHEMISQSEATGHRTRFALEELAPKAKRSKTVLQPVVATAVAAAEPKKKSKAETKAKAAKISKKNAAKHAAKHAKFSKAKPAKAE